MGTFTVTLREAIDLSAPVDPYVALGLNEYPLFDEGYRQHLNDKLIDHFDEQEIGLETISMFRHAMKRKMNEVMPLFNQHYRASLIQIDPLLTINIKTIGTGTALTTGSETLTGTEENTTESSSTAAGRVVASNTPQVRLAGNGDYATSAQDSTSKTDADGSGTTTSNRENVNSLENATNNDGSTTGYQGNPAELIWQLRQTFVNIDMMVIDSLQELFMMVWDNGEEFTKGTYLNVYTGFYPFYG